jgi:hypothetical protein
MNSDNLPDASSISQPAIRKSRVVLDTARHAFNAAGKTLIQLERELPNAQDADAAADEAARAQGKPPLKGRPQTKRAEDAIANAAHEQRVAELARTRAADDLEAVLAKNLAAWQEEVTAEMELRDSEWDVLINGLIVAANKRSAVRQVGQKILETDVLAAAAVPFRLRQLDGIEVQNGSSRTAYVAVEDILVGLQELGFKIAEPERAREYGAPNIAPLEAPKDYRSTSPEVEDFLAYRREQAANGGVAA